MLLYNKMKLILNFRDAVITQLNNPGCEYKFEFDLSKMNKPRLSRDARMYIETLNLPEFFDEVLGVDRGKYRGYFEIRCNNVDAGNNFDTEYGNTNNSIIYTSPLDGLRTFTNTQPMFVSNFKVNQSFLQDKFILHMKIYDHNGDPFIAGYNVVTEINQDISSDYATKLTAFTQKKDLYDATKKVADDIDKDIALQKSKNAHLAYQFNTSVNNLISESKSFIKRAGTDKNSIRARLRAEQMIILLSTYNINLFSFLFDTLFLTKNSPYNNLRNDIDDTRTDFVNYHIGLVQLNQLKRRYAEVIGAEPIVYHDVYGVFSDKTISLKSDNKKVNYEVAVPGGTNKTGSMDIQYFNSAPEKQEIISINNITPTDSSSTHELVKNDVLKVASTQFQILNEDPFEFFFVKATETVPNDIEIAPGVTAVHKNKRFAIKVTRTGTTYDYELLKDVSVERFAINDTITIKGTFLGGDSPANDMTIKIDAVYVPPPSVTYPNVSSIITDPNKGAVILDIVRNNNTRKYEIIRQDFSGTKDFAVGDEIVIPGDVLGGSTPTNDYKLEVDEILEDNIPDLEIKINENNSSHILPEITINDTNSSTSGTGSAYTFKVQTRNGVYIPILDATDTSTNFAVNEIITIEGSKLGGIDITNDLEVIVTEIDGSGKITALQQHSGTGRKESTYEFRVTLSKDKTDYSIEHVSGNGFQINDEIFIDGRQLVGNSIINDLSVKITDITPKIVGTPTGVADYSGPDGRIVSLTELNNKPYINVANGSFVKADTTITGTAVNTSTITKPELNITIRESPIIGLGNLKAELSVAQTDLDNAKKTLIPKRSKYQTTFGSAQLQKMKTMSMNLVLYDELDEYTQSSQDAIKGNTYSRVQNCQFKRI